MDTIATLNIDRNVVENEEYSVSMPPENEAVDDKPLGPITRRLAGIIKLDSKINHKEVLTDVLLEKYL